MEDDGRDGALEVPIAPVRGQGGGRRRAGAVVSGAIVVIGIAIVLANLPSRDRSPSTGDVALQGSPGVADGTPPGEALPSPSLPRPQASSSRHEALLSVGNEPLTEAPNVVLIERVGDDAQLMAWNPGDPLRVAGTFPNAFTGDSQTAVVSPDASSLVVATIHPGGEDAEDAARLVNDKGRVLWEGTGITTLRGITWSSDSSKVVLVGAPGIWWVVTVVGAETATAQRITVGGEPAPAASPPRAGPSASPSNDLLDLTPVGFSADGAWLYASPVPRTGGTAGPTVRVSVPGGIVDTIMEYSSSGPARMAADDGLHGIDPATGRTIRWGPNASIPGGPPTVEVTDANGAVAYRIETGVVLGAAWQAGGDLLILAADGFPFPTRLRLLPIAPDGTLGAPVLSTGSVAWGGLLGVRDGYAALAIGTRQPTDSTQLVMVDLVSGTASGMTLPAAEMEILGASLLP